MSSADDSFKPDKIIKAKKGESRWKVAANERTPRALSRFAPSAPQEHSVALLPAQWQIDEAKAEAEENGETYNGPVAYRGIELIARAKHLGLQSDSTEASRTGSGWTETLEKQREVSTVRSTLSGSLKAAVAVELRMRVGTVSDSDTQLSLLRRCVHGLQTSASTQNLHAASRQRLQQGGVWGSIRQR